MPVEKKSADHPVGRLLGVKVGDSKIEAANKAIQTMKAAGFPQREINKAIKMRDAAIARGVN